MPPILTVMTLGSDSPSLEDEDLESEGKLHPGPTPEVLPEDDFTVPVPF